MTRPARSSHRPRGGRQLNEARVIITIRSRSRSSNGYAVVVATAAHVPLDAEMIGPMTAAPAAAATASPPTPPARQPAAQAVQPRADRRGVGAFPDQQDQCDEGAGIERQEEAVRDRGEGLHV